MRQLEFYFVQLELKRNKWFAPPGRHTADYSGAMVQQMSGAVVTFKKGRPFFYKQDPIAPGDLVYMMYGGTVAKANEKHQPIGIAIAVYEKFVDVRVNPA